MELWVVLMMLGVSAMGLIDRRVIPVRPSLAPLGGWFAVLMAILGLVLSILHQSWIVAVAAGIAAVILAWITTTLRPTTRTRPNDSRPTRDEGTA